MIWQNKIENNFTAETNQIIKKFLEELFSILLNNLMSGNLQLCLENKLV